MYKSIIESIKNHHFIETLYKANSNGVYRRRLVCLHSLYSSSPSAYHRFNARRESQIRKIQSQTLLALDQFSKRGEK